MNTIGLVVGGGTGPELADIFRRAATVWSERSGAPAGIAECPHLSRSFTEMLTWGTAEIEEAVKRDAAELMKFYRSFYASGGRFIFRTAVNAETLYLLRLRLQAVKVAHLTLDGHRVTLMRDELQGFYSNDDWKIASDHIDFHGFFSRDGFRTILEYGTAEANSWLREGYATWVVYKHHLFANAMAAWVREIAPAAALFQPGAAYSNLRKHLSSEGCDLLLIAGNEIGDLLAEVFMLQEGWSYREMSFSRNIHLDPSVRGLEEYQTVHGSADDLAGTNRVNPLATLRAAAAIVEKSSQVSGRVSGLERVIQNAPASLLSETGQMLCSTQELADWVIERAVRERAFSAGPRQ